MPRSTMLTLLAAAALAGAASPALAATAHNSQAGAWGPNSDQCAPTPYFPAGGCAASAFEGDGLLSFDEPPPRYRAGRRLTHPQAPLADPDE